MKPKILLSLLLSFNFCLLSSQIPQGFNYQAIARNASGDAITNISLPVRITIQSDSLGGTTFWIEEHLSVSTNSYGLFTLIIGKGAKKIGSTANTFNDIDWTVTPKFIKTEIDYSGWKNMGSSRLWTVPYAMVTARADSAKALLKGSKLSVVSGNDLSADALFEVKRKDGQTVFAVYPDAVNIYVPRTAKGTKGGFAIGGFETAKLGPQDYFRVTPDSVRVYIDKTPSIVKGATKGGFAIGGFDQVKGGIQDLLTVSNDSIRMYIDNNPAPGKAATKGGFAIGGFDQVKGTATSYTSLTPENYFIGHEAGMSNTTGLYNSFFGYKAGRSNTTGNYNIFIGDRCGTSNTTGYYNLFIGDSCGYRNTTGSYNSFLGPFSGLENTTGNANSFMGTGSGFNNTTGIFNTNLGEESGFTNTTGNRNTLVGTAAGYWNKTGSENVMFGVYSGYRNLGNNNVYVGSYAGTNNLTGSWNVFIGYGAGENATSSQRLYIANSNTSSPLIYGEFDNSRLIINGNSVNNVFSRTLFVNGNAGGLTAWFNDSDRKLKHDIVTIPDALQKVLMLRGVNFLWNDPGEGMDGLQMGFIGQEAEVVVPEVVTVRNDHYSMQYAPVTALLVEGMKEQQKQIDDQKKEIDELKELVNILMQNQTKQGSK